MNSDSHIIVGTDALFRKPKSNLICTISINSETYKKIKDEYKEDAYLKNVLKMLEDSRSDEAK
ncbi:19661_t:CDS:2 [Gigaspora margarita]|uniref:19661_t:CDS:1 n=1 Tax=Gigaspora margarita TaxID=4874 RepID=A0ABN7VAW4_GIGMA|nr:19661_t:CDS:2 [Gigaspora margarita]